MGFTECCGVVLDHEGGYVNDKDDPGGETKFGITKRQYPELNIKELTIGEAMDIYKRDYWNKGKVSSVPSGLQLIYFDMVVNVGKSRAVKILQSALNGKGIPTTVDGGIGPNTIRNLKKSNLEPERLRSYRIKYYADLVSRKPTLEKYWYGWYRRAKKT
jgi:lysozyme family protein|tara:strand:+ start:3145 stop:3621 length:477 start_codon:yes stop_codon:yes gene_type:complete